GYTWSFQMYEFIHSARYIVFGVRAADNSAQPSEFRVDAWDGSTRLGRVLMDRNSGYSPLVVELGTPTFSRRRINLRLGFLRQHKNSERDIIAFRINRIYLTDEP